MSGTGTTAPGKGSMGKAGFTEEAIPWLDAVYRFAVRLTGGNDAEAQDLVQETYLRAYRAWESYTPGTNCRSWLFTICRNTFLRQEDQRGRRPEVGASQAAVDLEAFGGEDSATATPPADPERRFFDSFVDEEVLAAVDRLPEEFREAVVLSDLEGVAYTEISEVLRVPVGTVKSRIYRGRRLLQQALWDYAVEMGHVRGDGSDE